MELEGPKTGPYSGFLFVSTNRGVSPQILNFLNNSKVSLGGVTYAPDYNVTFLDGVDVAAASPVTTIIGESITVALNASLEVANDPDLAPYAPRIEINNGWARLIK
jgi:hypothetical protein